MATLTKLNVGVSPTTGKITKTVTATPAYVYSSGSPKVAVAAASNVAKTGTAIYTGPAAKTANVTQVVTPTSSPTLAADIAVYEAIPAAQRTAKQNAALATDIATQARQSGSATVVVGQSATSTRSPVSAQPSLGSSTPLTHAPTAQAPTAAAPASGYSGAAPSSLTGAAVGVGPGSVASQVASDQGQGDQGQGDQGQAISGGTGNVGGMESPATGTSSSLPSLSTLGLVAGAGLLGYYLLKHKKGKKLL